MIGSAPASPAAPFLNVLDPAFDFGSPEAAAAREHSWYAESPIGLLVLRYEEAHELLRDQRLKPNSEKYLEMNGISDGPIYNWFVPMIGNQNGDEHRRIRGLVNKAFTPRMINDLRGFIRVQAENLAAEMARTGVCDFVEDFANKLPLAVMCQMLGIPPADYETFRTWSTDIGLVFSLASGTDTATRVENAVIGLTEYSEFLIQNKKAHPTDDLISALVAAHEADGGVSMAEIRNLLVTLVFAAHDTTRHQLSNAMVTFSEHPAQWTLLGERPELTAQAVEEVIRWRPAATTLFRFAREDFDYRDLRIAQDTFLLVCAAPAQRDPRAYQDAGTFDITVTRDTPALQFGGGPHYCLGAALARAELGEALPVLARRLGPPSIAGPYSSRGPVGICGPETLPLSFG
ncbi:cytochrome P450 [Nonomuraea diastatica]|uniref:Cytochrome P450 n=2 Tax=Nonomuraea diastatica TaxID=1848329 RepID=A0A4R4WN24_9ACTN|nr:cytochrome P450 [Nonomuraea diastatica]